MLLCCFLPPAELRGRVPLGGELDEDAHSSSQRCGDPDGSGPVSQNQQELRWNPLAQDLHAHLREWDLIPTVHVMDPFKPWINVVQGGDAIISTTLSCTSFSSRWKLKLLCSIHVVVLSLSIWFMSFITSVCWDKAVKRVFEFLFLHTHALFYLHHTPSSSQVLPTLLEIKNNYNNPIKQWIFKWLIKLHNL